MPAIPFVCVRAHPSPAPRHPPAPRKSERIPPRRPYTPSPRRARLNFQQRQRARLVPAWNLFGTFQRPWPATSQAGRLTVLPARAAPLVAAADAPVPAPAGAIGRKFARALPKHPPSAIAHLIPAHTTPDREHTDLCAMRSVPLAKFARVRELSGTVRPTSVCMFD